MSSEVITKNDLMNILNEIVIQTSIQDITTYSNNGTTITIPSGAAYKINTFETITLPANGKYLVIMNGGCGATSGTTTYYTIQTNLASGTPVVANHIRQQTNTISGGPNSGAGYFETGDSAITVYIQGCLYGSANSTCNGWHNTQVIKLR